MVLSHAPLPVWLRPHVPFSYHALPEQTEWHTLIVYHSENLDRILLTVMKFVRSRTWRDPSCRDSQMKRDLTPDPEKKIQACGRQPHAQLKMPTLRMAIDVDISIAVEAASQEIRKVLGRDPQCFDSLRFAWRQGRWRAENRRNDDFRTALESISAPFPRPSPRVQFYSLVRGIHEKQERVQDPWT